MGIIVTVTGGMRSGKSTFAELLAKEKGGRDVLYIATMKPIDEECIERIKKHRDRRPKDWLTVEVYSDIDVVIARSGKKVGILDCLTNMVSNIMMEIDLSWDNVTN
ncbi:MAG: bifunctional adenosylcobinamide kinase/adenosylcobinamide-phosphate guanylyltransferase, partial [Thermosulfidibacteraceae bacterium]